MTSTVSADIKRGRLLTHEREQIKVLASRNLGAGQIAAKMNRHPATINFAMHSMGLRTLSGQRHAPYTRKNGTVVVSFCPDEDAMLEAMRIDGAVCRVIAEACFEKFGRKRSAASVNMRLKMLANKEDGR